MAKKSKPRGPGLFTGELPKMPEGYYSGDKPNPNLRAFVEQHLRERPYDPETDDYDVLAFSEAIQATKVDPVYNLHPYDSKKSHQAIRQYIRHYARPGDIVLDPFCGSGSTLVAASSEGCPSIGIDFSPLATFISSETVGPRDVEDLRTALAALAACAERAVRHLYRTTCHRCGGEAEVMGAVISEKFQCVRCLDIHPWYACLPTDRSTKGLCPTCHKRGVDSEITTSFARKGSAIVQIDFQCLGHCKPKRAKRSILDQDTAAQTALANDIKAAEAIAVDVPSRLRVRMMGASQEQERWGLLWRPYLRGYDAPADFFTSRNLKACLLLYDAIRARCDNSLLLVLSSILAKASHLMAQNPDGIGRVMKGTYYIGAVRREVNVWHFYLDAFNAIMKAKEDINESLRAPALISCQDSTRMDQVPTNSVDYIFTDPPYSGKVQFGELNYLREAFLGLGRAELTREIIINDGRQLAEGEWSGRMRAVACEMYRTLKPGRWVTLCYHDTSEGTWAIVQDIMTEAGFLPDSNTSAVYIETRQKSIKQITADKVNRRDLVISFRKPKPGEFRVTQLFIPADVDEHTFQELACQVIRERLQAHPGATKDRVYDELVSQMVRAGKMEAHDFDALLAQVADRVIQPGAKEDTSRWYLKDHELEVTDAAESAREDAAAEKIGDFIEKVLEDNPGQEGVHYSNVFEQYVYSVQDKPRRPLAEWLLDYFYKTDEGTYRRPAGEDEQQLKAEGRKAGTNRKIKRYVALLEQSLTIPEKIRPNDATLAEWILACKRSGLYGQGKLLYEKGGLDLDELPEEVMVNVEEDYQVCARMLARDVGGTRKKAKRGRRKKSEIDE